MLHNTHRPMEYASSLTYYNYHQNDHPGDSNFARYNLEPYNRDGYAYNGDRTDNYRRDVTAFYHSNPTSSGKHHQSHAYSDNIPESAPAIADFNANMAATPKPPAEAASPTAYGNVADNPVKPALPTFPWMNYSSEDGKRKRQSYSRRQTLELEKEFRYSEYLTKKRRSELCHMLQLSEKQIKTWFQNRRMKKKKEKEKHFEVPNLHEPDIPAPCPVTPAEPESQDYWEKAAVATNGPGLLEEPYKANQTSQFVPDTSHVYFNAPYEMNYT